MTFVFSKKFPPFLIVTNSLSRWSGCSLICFHWWAPKIGVNDALPTPWRTQMWIQIKNSGRRKSRSTLPSSQHFEGWKCVLELWDGTRKSWQASLTQTGLHTAHTKWLVHSWNTFGARTSHKQHRHIRLTTARTWGKPLPSPPYSIYCGWS